MLNFVCVNVGPKYPMRYVEVLLDMVIRNSSNVEGERAFWCLTDRKDELPAGVGYIPADPDLPGWWQKVALFDPAMPWEPGERVVYFDLDVAITGRLEDLAQRKGIIKDWRWPCYNSSVMVWDHGEHREVWDAFTPDIISRSPGPIVPRELLASGMINGGDQEYLTEIGGWETFPAGWFISYRDARAWPPNDCRAVIFHGADKPADIETGWVPNTWRVGGYTSLPQMNGVNVGYDQIEGNIRAAVARELPWFTGWKPTKKPAVLVCGSPSMKDRLSQIRAHQRRGARIITVNNALRYLLERGIKPDAHVMLDARPENADFVKDAPEGIRYLIASQCDPAVFEALEGREVVVWHNGFGDNEVLRRVLEPWWDEGPNQRPCILVPGGGTVGLRAMWLAGYSGFGTLHIYGMDSSYAADGAHHAYGQALNDGEATMEVALLKGGAEKRYRCARWMVRQAEEFKEAWVHLKREFGMTIHVHGDGLIPDVAQALKEEARGK